MQRIVLAILLLISTGFVHAQFQAGATYSGFNPEQFGTVAVGSSNTLSRFIVINSGSTVPVQIGVATTGSGYSITGGTCLPGATLVTPSGQCTLQLTFAPTVAGAAVGNLAINCTPVLVSGGVAVNCSDQGGDTTNIALQGTGVGATSLPSIGRLGLSMLALALFALALWSMRRNRV